MSSCLEDEAPEDVFGQGPNLVTFADKSTNMQVIATGEEFSFTLPMKIKGPSVRDLKGTVTANIAVHSSSTAVEGVHFKLDQKSITLTDGQDFLGTLPITVLTDGIDPPLAENPVVVLEITSVSGAENVIASGTKITVNLLYLCDSQLQGSYVVTIVRNDGNTYVFNDEIAKVGDGEYRGESVGHWAPGAIGGEPGFNFIDVCNVITVPEQNLVNLYSNQVYQAGPSYVDPVTGNIHIEYGITFSAGDRTYVADYVKQ